MARKEESPHHPPWLLRLVGVDGDGDVIIGDRNTVERELGYFGRSSNIASSGITQRSTEHLEKQPQP